MRCLQWNPVAMRAAIDPSMFATDRAIDFARDGVPFRQAYQRAADPAQWHGDADASLAARTSPGGAG
jgi:argininosuccinate lyase